MENGSTAGVAVTGNDGMVGLAIVLGGESSSTRTVVQITGDAFRMQSKILKNECLRGGCLQKILLRYVLAFIAQISQTAVCNSLHRIEQKLCRTLLVNHDLLQTNKLAMTHEIIANQLGVRREGINEAARKLQKQGLISYVRGTITLLDQKGLEKKACECFQVVKDEYGRLLP